MADPVQSQAKAARLAAALRANLARRKARERGETADGATNELPVRVVPAEAAAHDH